jgi:hypothetical protein
MYKNMIGVMLQKIIKIILLLVTTFVYSQQKIVYYNYGYGYDGMEKIGRVVDSTLIYSNFQARPEIRAEVADSVLSKYKKLKEGPLTIKIKSGKVFGRIKLIKQEQLILVNYYFERIEYTNGLIEIYKNPLKK